MLLFVSLASLTRVETQVAGNSQQLGQARQNALMALNIALGQLQKTIGLGQRTTAHADTHRRVLLHIDELDKFQLNFADGDWSASIGSDLWNLLDGKFPFESYLRESTFSEEPPPTVEALNDIVLNGLWIVGSGTWQAIFEKNRKGSTVGFQGSRFADTVDAQAIVWSGIMHGELLHRFNSDFLFLDYPSLEETRQLLTTTGLGNLAKKVGVTLVPEEIDWTQGGIRALETVATRLVIAGFRRDQQNTGPASKASGQSAPRRSSMMAPAAAAGSLTVASRHSRRVSPPGLLTL